MIETERAWQRGHQTWLTYLDATGWYPGRRDEWVDLRLQMVTIEPAGKPRPPQRATGRYLGGHPALPRPCRVVLTRTAGEVVITVDGYWPVRPTRVVLPLQAVRSVSVQRTTENTPDDAVVTAAIGGARTGPLGMAFGAAVGRRRRVVRTVHVHVRLDSGPAELVFRAMDDRGERGPAMLARIFQLV
jgi:hypothetical protein